MKEPEQPAPEKREADEQGGLQAWVLPAGFGGIVVLVLLVIVLNAMQPSREQRVSDRENNPPTPAAFAPPTAGVLVEPPRQLTDFALLNQDNEPTRLSDLAGKPVLLYFGYTFCPDICPTTLADMVRVRQQLDERADEVQFVFVSVDGARDTPAVVKAYLENFDAAFIGLTGEARLLRPLKEEYGLVINQVEVEGTTADYLIDHSAATYLIDRDGQLRVVYGYGMPPDVMVDDIRALLDGTLAGA